MFEKRRRLRQQYAALCHYEDEIMRKDRVIREASVTLQEADRMQRVLEECNDALAKENKRLADNADLDQDMMTEMYTEYKDMLRKYRDYQELADENYRLWVENSLLRGALSRLAPRQAAEIARCGR